MKTTLFPKDLTLWIVTLWIVTRLLLHAHDWDATSKIQIFLTNNVKLEFDLTPMASFGNGVGFRDTHPCNWTHFHGSQPYGVSSDESFCDHDNSVWNKYRNVLPLKCGNPDRRSILYYSPGLSILRWQVAHARKVLYEDDNSIICDKNFHIYERSPNEVQPVPPTFCHNLLLPPATRRVSLPPISILRK